VLLTGRFLTFDILCLLITEKPTRGFVARLLTERLGRPQNSAHISVKPLGRGACSPRKLPAMGWSLLAPGAPRLARQGESNFSLGGCEQKSPYRQGATSGLS